MNASEIVMHLIVERLSLSTPPKPQEQLHQLGLDSLDIVELVQEIENLLEVNIPEDQIGEQMTVAQLIALVKQ